MPESIDAPLIELFQRYADDELQPEDEQRLADALQNNSVTQEAFVNFCLHTQVLKELLAEESPPRRYTNRADPAVNASRRVAVITSLIACLLLMLFVRLPNTFRLLLTADSRNAVLPDLHWTITAGSDTQYTVQSPSLVELTRGELYIASRDAPGPSPLRIVTPGGEAAVNGTRFYIGTHLAPKPKAKSDNMLQPITRVLVLSGMVTLSTANGRVQGQDGDLLLASDRSAPEKIVVQTSSDFALSLYRELTGDSQESNLLFSPYSVSQALAMTLEGSRGQTAQEIGGILYLPDECRRLGNDSQAIPWKTSLLHTGFASLNDRLSAASNYPNYCRLRATLAELEAETVAAQERINAMLSDKFGAFMYPTREDTEKVAYDEQEVERLQERVKVLQRRRTEMENDLPPVEVRVGNAAFVDQSIPLRADYTSTLSEHYKTGGAIPVDFINEGESARRQINEWGQAETAGRITEFLPPLSTQTTAGLQIALINAVYFKADWETKFDVGLTKAESFTRADHSTVSTPIMNGSDFTVGYAAFNQDGSLFPTPSKIKLRQSEGLYPDADGFLVAEFPYRGQEVSMVVMVPNRCDGLPNIERQLNTANLQQWIGHLQSRPVNVALPKFRSEANWDLKPILTRMGMRSAFSPQADFSGLSNRSASLSLVQHKAVIEVNETRTVAAAATVSGGLFGGPPTIPFVPDFRADRPFLYLIRDVKSNTILFLGRMMIP